MHGTRGSHCLDAQKDDIGLLLGKLTCNNFMVRLAAIEERPSICKGIFVPRIVRPHGIMQAIQEKRSSQGLSRLHFVVSEASESILTYILVCRSFNSGTYAALLPDHCPSSETYHNAILQASLQLACGFLPS
jgi:hypothetical protein